MDPTSDPDALPRLFADALDLPPAERAAFLDAACGAAGSLRSEIDALLDLHPAATRFFDRTPAPSFRAAESGPDRIEGSVVGPYRILEEIASGGMGTVYRAERTDRAFQKTVAIKLIRSGLMTPEAVARFRTERQVLADLEHPGIARLIDGGSMPDGRPWLVMELVDGVPLSRYLATRPVDVTARIALFLEVCAAVQYAHRNLVVHRDLKPGNILVDAGGRVKLLDFGIAKVLDPRPAVDAGLTGAAQPFTTRYASPEQVNGGRITTATDIYSLGVILYETLCGAFPYELDGKTPLAMIETITEAKPVRPSRRVEPALAKRLAGDLDMIVLKALAKEPERRYATVEELAADLRRHLRGEPVSARPDTAAYRLSTFVRRNRTLVAATCGTIGLLAAALIVTVTAYRNVTASRNAAEFETYVASLAAAEASLVTDKTGEAALHLRAAPPALRGWEWGHLVARLDRSRAVMPARRAGINSLAVSRDATIAVASEDSTIAVLSASGSVVESYGPFPSSVESAAFARGDRDLVAGLTDGAVLRIARDGGAVDTLSPAGRQWALLGVSPDGSRLAAGFFDGFVRVWSLPDRALIAEWPAHDRLAVVAWSPDGRYLATGGGEGVVILTDARTLAPVRRIAAHERRVYTLAWSADGRHLATGSMDRTARVWEIPEGRLVTTFREHRGTVSALAFDPAGRRILSSGSDSRPLLWDAITGSVLAAFRGHISDVSAIATGPDPDVVYSGDWSGQVRRWSWRTEDVRTLSIPRNSFQIPASYHADVDPAGTRLVIATNLPDAPVWRLDGGAAPERLVHIEPGYRVRFARRDASVISGTQKGQIRILTVANEVIASVDAHAGTILGMALSPGGDLLATAAEDSIVKLWTVPGLAVAGSLGGARGGHLDLAFSPGGDRLAAAGADGSVRLWDVRTGRVTHRLQAGSRRLPAIAFDPEGKRLATAGADGAVRMLDLDRETWTTLREPGAAPMMSIAWSRDGSRIAAGGGDEIVRLFDVRRGREVTSLHGHTGRITSLLFLPDDRALVSTSTDGTVKLWEAGTDSTETRFAAAVR